MRASSIASGICKWAAIIALLGVGVASQAQSEVHFRVFRDSSLICVPVLVNRAIVAEFILDTGADTTIIDSSAGIGQLEASPLRVTQRTVNGTWEPNLVHLEEINMGDARVEGLNVLTADLSSLRRTAPGVIGVLGQDFLTHFDYVVDYRRQVLHVGVEREFEDAFGGERLPIQFANGRMLVNVLADKTSPYLMRLLLDSGANVVALTPGASKAVHAILSTVKAETAVNATVTVPAGRIPHLVIASHTFENIPVIVSPGLEREQFCDGLLPMSLLGPILVNNREKFVAILRDPGR